MLKVYIDTSVLIAIANPADVFHGRSITFLEELRQRSIAFTTGSPLLLEIGKAVQHRGVTAGLSLLQAVEEQHIDLTFVSSARLLRLVNAYVEAKASPRYRVDLLHYAAATLLKSTHLASWDRAHFNRAMETKINRVNQLHGLGTLKVGDPMLIGRSLGIGQN